MDSQNISPVNKQRESSIELLRIVAMLFIIAHHYVTNSGLLLPNGPVYTQFPSIHSCFLLVFGAWGKTGINCFVLITGYFMCRSTIRPKKYLKLLLEYMFYHVLIWLIFCVCGYESFSVRSLIKQLIPITDVGRSFTSAFLLFYLFIPFLNILIHNMKKRQHFLLIALFVFAYTVLGSIPVFTVTMNYLSWFTCIYLIGAYISTYPSKPRTKRMRGGGLLGVFFVASISIIGATYIAYYKGIVQGINTSYYFVHDSNKIFALIVSISVFNLFMEMRIPHSKIINRIAESVFGVLMIHAHGSTMRRWLWVDVLDNVGHFGSPWMYLHFFLSVICVFLACVVIDQLRIAFLEKPLFHFFDEHADNWHKVISCFEIRVKRL